MSVNNLEIRYPHEKTINTIVEKDCSKSFLLNNYNSFKQLMNSHINNGDDHKAVSLLDDYMNFAKSKEEDKTVTYKSNYYSSILEELPVLIVRNEVNDFLSKLEDVGLNMIIGDVNCVIREGRGVDVSRYTEKKRIDFCVALFENNGDPVPIIGLEAKKYVDKTMFATIKDTFNELKLLRPKTFYGFLCEDESRSDSVILNSPMHGNEFILTDGKRSKSLRKPINEYSYIRFKSRVVDELRRQIKEIIELRTNQ